MKKIALIGDWYSNNMGDPLLFKCHEKILNDIATDSTRFVFLDFFGRKHRSNVETTITVNTVKEQNISLRKKIIRHLYFSLPIKVQERITYSFLERIQFQKKKNSLHDYYYNNLKAVDAVIIVGAGTLKYDVRLDFGPYYKLITDVCNNLRIPCIISAVGVESFYNNKDYRCRRFSRVLSSNIVKCITTRDNIDELKLYIRNKNTEIYKIPDPGIWSANCFSLKKNDKSKVVGIGIIDYRRFIEFNKGITKEQYENAIISLIEKLENKGIQWEFFNNGSGEDARFATYLLTKLQKTSDKTVKTPASPEELVEIISNYKGIITSRLHSCIVAYSLDIPYVAICWNNKLKYFADFIGVSERIIEADRLNSEELMECFDNATRLGYDNRLREKYLSDIQIIMKKYLQYI